jgi:hypothetical protein
MKTVLITTSRTPEIIGIHPDHVARDLSEAARIIRAALALRSEMAE